MNKEKNTITTSDMETMTSEELRQVIRAELDGPKDPKVVRNALRILEERDTVDVPVSSDVKEAWNKYKQFEVKKPVRKPRIILLRIATAAAILIMLTTMIPKVFGEENIVTLIGRWSKDLFSFGSPDQETPGVEYIFKTDHPGLQSVYDVVVNAGITQPVVPMWVPEEYQLEDVRVIQQSKSIKIVGKLSHGNSNIIITIEQFEDSWQNKYNKDDGPVSEVEIEGILHYIVSNVEMSTAIWHHDNLECHITTDLRANDLKKVLLSIY